eukprot:TRINITY_DN6873_c0_g2_i1.p2 TRINITY_DN6873_c0_g2~~TRINITY_DN6873_c0_g2_i1.p2  ORF type:complete len:135 (+),score=10.44 TRINITY_DN6873_c0_g2_i1:32-406(+)
MSVKFQGEVQWLNGCSSLPSSVRRARTELSAGLGKFVASVTVRRTLVSARSVTAYDVAGAMSKTSLETILKFQKHFQSQPSFIHMAYPGDKIWGHIIPGALYTTIAGGCLAMMVNFTLGTGKKA